MQGWALEPEAPAGALAWVSALALVPGLVSAWELAVRATEREPAQELEWVPVSALMAVLDSTPGAAAGAAVQPVQSLEPVRRSVQFPRCGYW